MKGSGFSARMIESILERCFCKYTALDKEYEMKQSVNNSRLGSSDTCRPDMQPILTEWRQFLRDYKNLIWVLGIAVALVYGLRIIHDNIFLDSEITVLQPEFMHSVWLGSNRFGMVLTSGLFGMKRLSPFLSGAMMAVTMWASALLLAFSVYSWSGQSRRYRYFIYVFPILFISAPVFAAQYQFVLQAFEVSFGILLCIAAVFCISRFLLGGQAGWLAAGLVLMVWSFGTYQVMFSVYICLVLVSYLTFYLNNKGARALELGLKHAGIFLTGCVIYVIVVWITRRLTGTDSTYVSEMVHWRTEDWRVCLAHIREEIRRIMKGEGVFYQWFYLPAMCLFVLQAMWEGWKKKEGWIPYLCFLFGGGLLLWSPFFLTVIAGFLQPVRTQLVYPLTAALFLSHLTVLPAGESLLRRRIAAAMTAVCVCCSLHQGVTTVQLFQTSWEAYRNDVLTANRIYADLCRIADRSDMSDCLVIFTGGRDAGLAGPVVEGELIGLSFFEAEAHTSVGVTGRVSSLFSILGLKVQVMTAEQTDLYQQAISYMQDAPDWPAEGSIRMMGDAVIVRLSEHQGEVY